MEFFNALKSGLQANGGRLSLQQVTDMLPDSSKHKVMYHLNNARNSGIVKYTTKRNAEGQMEVIITSPDPVAPQAVNRAVTNPQTLVGGRE